MVLGILSHRLGGRAPDVEALKERADTAKLVSAVRHRDPAIREAAATALGQLACVDAIPALADALSDSEWMVRRAAVKALTCLITSSADKPSSQPTTEQDIRVQRAAASKSRKYSKGADRAFLTENLSAEFVRVLGDKVWQVREAAADALGTLAPQIEAQSQHEISMNALLDSLGDERLPVRKAAARSLANLRPADLGPMSAALNDSDWQRREGATLALGLLAQEGQDSEQQDQIVEILVGRLADPDLRLRLATVRALGQIGQCIETGHRRQQILDSLAGTLADRDGQVREAAARALGRIGDAGATNSLVDLLEDPKESVRSSAAQALDRLARAQGIQTGPMRT
jgi:HEAT repeat protein